MIVTYVLKYKNKQGLCNYYCGITNNLKRRLFEHKIGLRTNHKKDIINYFYFKGNYEKKIKSFGVRFIYLLIHDLRTPKES